MDGANGSLHLLEWLDHVEGGDPDIPLISNVSPQQDDNTTGGLVKLRLRGAPAPLPTIDTNISNSIEEVVQRRGAESLPELDLEKVVSRFRPIVTSPTSDVSSSDKDSESSENDKPPPGRFREIRPDDFLRDPRQTFVPRTTSQKQARRERYITQMHLEVDVNVTEPDTLHAFMRHSIMAVPPPSKYHDCRCPGGSTVPFIERSAAFDETPVPDESDAPGNDTDSNCSDRFALSDDSENDLVGADGRPVGRGIERRPIHQDGGLATLVRLSEQGYTDTLLTTLEKRTPDKGEDFGTFDGTSGCIPIWLEGVSPSYSPWTSPLGYVPPRSWTDYEQVTVFLKRTPPAGFDPERDLADGLTVDEYEMEELDWPAAYPIQRMDEAEEDAPEEETLPLVPKSVRKSRFIENLPESNPNYRVSTDEDERPLVEGAKYPNDLERGHVDDEWRKPVKRWRIMRRMFIPIALLVVITTGSVILVVGDREAAKSD